MIVILILGTQAVLGVIPDSLIHLPLPQIWIIIWYFMVYFMMLTCTVYNLTAAVNSFLEVLPKIPSLRVSVVGIFCSLGMVIGLLLATPYGRPFFNNWIDSAYPLSLAVVFMAYSICISYIYTVDDLVNDYDFTYHRKPVRYWVANWQVAPVICLVCTVDIDVNVLYM